MSQSEVLTTTEEEKKNIPQPECIESLKNDGKEGKEFRIQNRRLFLTYPTHLNKVAVKDYFKKTFNAKRIEICHETGDEQCPYLHSHLYVDFGKNFQSKNARIFDLQGGAIDADGNCEMIHPNIQFIKSAKHEENVLRYMGKEDPECAELVKDEPLFYDMVMSKESRDQMLRDCAKRASDVPGLIALYALKPQEAADLPPLPLDWQRKLEKFLVETPADRRSIYWYFCRHGSTGKSELVEHMVRKYRKDVYFLNNFGRLADAMCIIANAIQGGWSGKILLVDLPRSFQDRANIFAALENVKNGLITTTKYNGGSTWIPNRTHVICFANFMPTFCAMSYDRWNVAELIQGPSCKDPDGKTVYLGEPRIELRNKEQCDAIQEEIDLGVLCEEFEKNSRMQRLEALRDAKYGVVSHQTMFSTSPVSQYSVNHNSL